MRDQARGGVAATGDDHEAEAQDVPVGEPLGLPVGALDLGRDEGAEEVVARARGRRLRDRRREVLHHLGHRLEGADGARLPCEGGRGRSRRSAAGSARGPTARTGPGRPRAPRTARRARTSGSCSRTRAWKSTAVAVAVATRRSRPAGPARTRGSGPRARVTRLRGEPAADQGAQPGLPGRVEHHDRRGDAELADLVGVEGQAARGGEHLGASYGVPDVREPGQRPELRRAAVRRVAVDRVVLAQPGERRVGVREELGVERVVGRGAGHLRSRF